MLLCSNVVFFVLWFVRISHNSLLKFNCSVLRALILYCAEIKLTRVLDFKIEIWNVECLSSAEVIVFRDQFCAKILLDFLFVKLTAVRIFFLDICVVETLVYHSICIVHSQMLKVWNVVLQLFPFSLLSRYNTQINTFRLVVLFFVSILSVSHNFSDISSM